MEATLAEALAAEDAPASGEEAHDRDAQAGTAKPIRQTTNGAIERMGRRQRTRWPWEMEVKEGSVRGVSLNGCRRPGQETG